MNEKRKKGKVIKSKRWGREWTREKQRRKGGTPAPREVGSYPVSVFICCSWRVARADTRQNLQRIVRVSFEFPLDQRRPLHEPTHHVINTTRLHRRHANEETRRWWLWCRSVNMDAFATLMDCCDLGLDLWPPANIPCKFHRDCSSRLWNVVVTRSVRRNERCWQTAQKQKNRSTMPDGEKHKKQVSKLNVDLYSASS